MVDMHTILSALSLPLVVSGVRVWGSGFIIILLSGDSQAPREARNPFDTSE